MTEDKETLDGLLGLLASDDKIKRASGRLIATAMQKELFNWLKAEGVRGETPGNSLQAMIKVLSALIVGYLMMSLKNETPNEVGEDIGEFLKRTFVSQFGEARKIWQQAAERAKS